MSKEYRIPLYIEDQLCREEEQLALKEKYPQECLCEAFPKLVANDCHVHNWFPKHFPPYVDYKYESAGKLCDCEEEENE